MAEGQPPDDTDAIRGIAGDPASGTVYLVLPSEVVAVSAQDGVVRWREPVEGSGNPALGSGLIVVPGGEGDMRGGGRRDRTLTVLRASQAGTELFEADARRKVLAAAVAALGEGRVGVGVLLVDPILEWLDDRETATFAAAVAKATGKSVPPVSGPDDDAGGK